MINAERNKKKKNRIKIQDSSTYHKCEKDVECFTGSGSTNVWFTGFM